MIPERERALTLAQEAEAKVGGSDPQAVVNRARVYLSFLQPAFASSEPLDEERRSGGVS